MIDLYTAATPNGHKISVALEEMRLDYNLTNVNLLENEQKSDKFLAMNPNGRIPVIVDHQPHMTNHSKSNEPFVLFESGAILIYLAEKTGLFYGNNQTQRYQIMQWVMFQMSGLGPMMGQANVFHRYFPERIDVVIDRYQNEVKRLLTILDEQLKGNDYLVGDFSIADIAMWTWAKTHNWSGVNIDELKHLQKWIDRIYERPTALKGSKLPPSAAAEDIVKSGQNIIQK